MFALLTVDVAATGYPHLLVGTCENQANTGVTLYENLAAADDSREFINPRLIGEAPCVPNAHGISTTDLDADGMVDIVFASFNDASLGPGWISVLRNLDDGTNFATNTFPVERLQEDGNTTSEHPTSVALAHIDEDDLPDLVVSTGLISRNLEGVSWYKNLGVNITSGEFMFSERYDIFVGGSALIEVVKVADIDGDSDQDVVFSGRPGRRFPTTWWNENLLSDLTVDGEDPPDAEDMFNSSFQASHLIFTYAEDVNQRTFYSSMVLADFDSDGNIDVLGSMTESLNEVGPGEVFMLRHLGGGEFEEYRRVIRCEK